MDNREAALRQPLHGTVYFVRLRSPVDNTSSGGGRGEIEISKNVCRRTSDVPVSALIAVLECPRIRDKV